MPLDDTYPLAVSFVVADRQQDDGTQRRVPIGTGFVLRVPSTTVEGLGFEYVVTAAHVVESGEPTWVRFRKRESDGVHDLSVPEWIAHPTADVALAPLRGHGEFGLHLLHIPLGALIGIPGGDRTPMLGESVYFLGVLAQVAAMGERNIPMVRSGTIGALYQERVPIKRADGSRGRLQAHLIDCRSYNGFSGSPCFIQREHMERTATGSIVYGHWTDLLGLVSGHFDDWGDARPPGPDRDPINTGVGIVTPTEKIIETLTLEEVVEDRERIEKEAAEKTEEGATLDARHGDRPEEFTRFEDLTRKLTKVPKRELDEKRKEQSS